MPSLSPELQPVVIVHDLTSTPGPDQEYIVEAALSTQPAVLAQYGHVILFNDSTDSLLRPIWVNVANGNLPMSWTASITKTGIAGALATTVVRLNQRVRPTFYSSNRLASTSDAVAVPNTRFWRSSGSLSLAVDTWIPEEVVKHIVLGPGDSLIVTAGVQNQLLEVSMVWKQEPLNAVYGQ